MRWPLLDVLSSAQAGDVLRNARHQTFGRGEVVFNEGDPGDAMYLVAAGHVAVRVTTPMGDRATVRVIGPGEFFGELALISPGPRNATIAAIEGAQTFVLRSDQLEHLRHTSPVIERALLEAIVQEVRRLSTQLLEAMYVPAPTRLVRRVVELARTYPVDPSGHVTVPLTQDDLASLCGTTRPTINQLLSKLTAEGLLDVRRGRIVVVDLETLTERGE